MNSLISKNKFYLWSFFLIIIQTLFGLLYSNISYSINITAYSVTLIFFLINHFVELYLAPSPKRTVPVSPRLIFLLDIIIILSLIYFIISDSLEAALLPLAYTILIHIQYFFIDYELEKIGMIAISLFKGILIPLITYYIQNQFVTNSLILYSVPFTFLIFILEFLKISYLSQKEVKTLLPRSNVVKLYLLFTFLFSFLIAWQAVRWWAIFLIIPFFIYRNKFVMAFVYLHVDIEKTINSIFQIYFSFSFLYILIFLVGLGF